MDSKLHIVPITQREANVFVLKHHRHHKPVVGSLFQIACSVEYEACDIKTRQEVKIHEIVGVAIVGRPTSYKIQENGKKEMNWTAEVVRLCTDGTKNACSMLYSAAWRAAKELGWKKLITYILYNETGASLYASNWRLIGIRGGGNWNSKSRPRIDTESNLQQKKLLFEAI